MSSRKSRDTLECRFGTRGIPLLTSNTGADVPNQDVFETAIHQQLPHRLASGPRNQFPGPWSVDGTRLAIYSGTQAEAHVWIVGVPAAGRRQLTKEPGTQAPSEWLPDGRLLIAASKPGERTTIWYLIRSSGAYHRPLPQLRGAISVAWHEN